MKDFTELPIGTRFRIINEIVTDKGTGAIPDELEKVDDQRAFRYNQVTGSFQGILQMQGNPTEQVIIQVLRYPADD